MAKATNSTKLRAAVAGYNAQQRAIAAMRTAERRASEAGLTLDTAGPIGDAESTIEAIRAAVSAIPKGTTMHDEDGAQWGQPLVEHFVNGKDFKALKKVR